MIIGGGLIAAAVIYLIISSTLANAQYFLTVDEVLNKGAAIYDKEIRISGAVIGESIQYDAQSIVLNFSIAHVAGDNQEIEKEGGLATALHLAVLDKNRARLKIIYHGVKPDLLRNEAQAILTGKMKPDGYFYASELLLKCPTKYEDAIPDQVK